jgi:hypothetical protein
MNLLGLGDHTSMRRIKALNDGDEALICRRRDAADLMTDGVL